MTRGWCQRGRGCEKLWPRWKSASFIEYALKGRLLNNGITRTMVPVRDGQHWRTYALNDMLLVLLLIGMVFTASDPLKRSSCGPDRRRIRFCLIGAVIPVIQWILPTSGTNGAVMTACATNTLCGLPREPECTVRTSAFPWRCRPTERSGTPPCGILSFA